MRKSLKRSVAFQILLSIAKSTNSGLEAAAGVAKALHRARKRKAAITDSRPRAPSNFEDLTYLQGQTSS
jgi:hypothetical protein